MNIRLITAILCAGVLVTGCSTTPPKPASAIYGQMDDFLTQLAARAGKNIGTADTFKIVVTQTQYPIGTLLHAGTTIPIDFTACLPSISPPKSPAPNLFPSYELSKSLAVGFGLENEALKKLANFGVSIKDTDKIDLSVKNTQVQTLADNDLWKLFAQTECRNAILPAANAWLIRGYILGQRSFVLSNENVRNINSNLEKVGSFNIDVNSGKTSLSITDENEAGFLQIVSQIDFILPKGKGINALKLSDLALVVTPPRVIGTSGHVYIQRDRLDTTDRAESVAKQLQGNSLAVTNSIEKVDGSYMPRLAQIRYFNDIDKPLALRALQELQKYFPDASLVKVELPAPAGQLEVWLPKVHI